ncbi:hypothetical protein ACFE04_030609 [Oxalis oulophora]
MAKAELVFIPVPSAGHLLSMLEIAKLLLQRDDRISISVLIIKLPSDLKELAFDRSLGDLTLSKRIRFIDVPYTENFSDSATFNLLSHVESHKSIVKEIMTKLFRSEGSFSFHQFLDFSKIVLMIGIGPHHSFRDID